MVLLPLILLSLLLLPFLALPGASYTHPQDNQIFNDFVSSLRGKGSLPASSDDWCSEDFGIYCGDDGKMTQIYISSYYLEGTIPASLGNLSSLQLLELNHNVLSGTIPSTLGNLAALQRLDLSYNLLSGPIPSTLGNLASLVQLYLYSNQLSGTIPSSLKNLPSLRALILMGINNFCPMVDYSSWVFETDFWGSTECTACASFTCQNNGRCSGGQNELFQCHCTHGWMGENCQESVPCNASTFYSLDAGKCLSCPPSSSSPSQSFGLSSCICSQPGLVPDPNTLTCQPCPSNTFLNFQNECQACPANSSSPPHSIGLSSCICLDGFSFNLATTSCEQIFCPATFTSNADFPLTPAGQSASGTCAPELTGAVSCLCNLGGQWEAVLGSCGKGELAAGAIAGVVVGSLVGALLFIGLGVAIFVFNKASIGKKSPSAIELQQ